MTAPSPFHEVQFPPNISYGAIGGPGFNTTVLTLASGFERRNINWSKARAQYDVAHGVKTQTDLDELLQFFYARNGKAYGFRFKDWADFNLSSAGTPQWVFATDGVTAAFQVSKIYTDAGNTYARPIRKPVGDTFTLFKAGVAWPFSGNWALDFNTGIVTITDAPTIASTGVVITCITQFDVPVRFDTDDMKTSINEYNNFSWGQIPLIEVRV